MKIKFTRADRDLVVSKLEELGVSVSESRVISVLYNVTAVLEQHLEDEVEYMIEEFELV